MEVELAIKNFQKQQSIFDAKAKYKIAVKGRRFGLTKGAANDFIKSALEKKFTRGLWVDTVNANIDKYIERYFVPHLKKLPSTMWDWRKQAKMLVINDAYIDFRSAEHPETMEGFGYDKAFLNEAGIILKDAYLWDNAIRPMFWDYPNIQVVIGGTPKGGGGKFEELARRGEDPSQPSYLTYHFSSFDSPFEHIHKAIREDMQSMPERVIKQEVYAEFLEDSGVVFRNVSSVCTEVPIPPVRDHMYVMGVDLAKVQDFTVIAVYDRSTNKQVYQSRFNTLEWPYQKKKIQEICMTYNRALISLDATGIGDPIADDLLRAGLPVEPMKLTNTSKKELIEKLSIWIEQKKLRMINDPLTITEFNNFTYDMSSQGRIIYNAPVGFNDDIVIAHALAIWLLQPLQEVRKEELSIVGKDLREKIKILQQPDDFEYSPDIEII